MLAIKLWFWSKGSRIRITTVTCKLSQWIPYDDNDTPVFNEVLWYFIYQTIWWWMLVRCQNVGAKEKPSMSVHTVWLCSSNLSTSPPSSSAAIDYEPFQACSIFMCGGLSRLTYVCFFCWLKCIHMQIWDCITHF